MNTVVISCRTLEAELNAALDNTGAAFPVIWLESGLHNTPKRLNERLSQEIGALKAERIILAMGFCGNSLSGLGSETAELIVPRLDDCISLLLGGMNERRRISSAHSAYFLTEGWMKGERNLWTEYQYSLAKYGKEQADIIAEMMYGHYRTLALVDTGVFPVEKLWTQTEEIAETLHLERKVFSGTLDRLQELLTGPWDPNRYLIVPPGERIAPTQMLPET